jgi:2-phosphosulfolactate phosphatase
MIVDTLDKAIALRSSGVGDYCIGERDSIKPPGFDFGNSPAELRGAEVAGKTLVQTRSTGAPGYPRALIFEDSRPAWVACLNLNGLVRC